MSGKFSCLIIEDDPSFSVVLEKIISKMEEVEWIGTCNNTNDAAIAIQKKKPNILLLDINIDGLDGPEILELSNYKPKTIVISSHAENVMTDYSVDYVQFIQKPITNPEQLMRAVRACIAMM